MPHKESMICASHKSSFCLYSMTCKISGYLSNLRDNHFLYTHDLRRAYWHVIDLE